MHFLRPCDIFPSNNMAYRKFVTCVFVYVLSVGMLLVYLYASVVYVKYKLLVLLILYLSGYIMYYINRTNPQGGREEKGRGSHGTKGQSDQYLINCNLIVSKQFLLNVFKF